jgi:putative glutamine amidotransferase
MIGITCDVNDREILTRRRYIDAVIDAGGAPILLPPVPATVSDAALGAFIDSYLRICSAFILTGGDDPVTEPFGVPTHPKAQRMHPNRQRFETALLRALDHYSHRNTPTLGICLGMQLMALASGGALNQHMPDNTPTHAEHYDDRAHALLAEADQSLFNDRPLRRGETLGAVTSRHRQSVSDPGRLRIIARAPDGVIEAIDDPARPFYLGVQWHPERTNFEPLGLAIFQRLVEAARKAQQSPK